MSIYGFVIGAMLMTHITDFVDFFSISRLEAP
jgi:hypothetical protein